MVLCQTDSLKNVASTLVSLFLLRVRYGNFTLHYNCHGQAKIMCNLNALIPTSRNTRLFVGHYSTPKVGQRLSTNHVAFQP